jgi:hypothetical protein
MLKTDAYFVILLVLMLVIVIGMKGINHEQDYEHEQDNCAVIPERSRGTLSRKLPVLSRDPSTSLRMTGRLTQPRD